MRRNAWAATFTAFIDAAGRRHEHPVEAVVEEAGQAPRRVEEVERVARRRRVDDDEVEVALLVQLVELLHRHVLLRARERAGDVAVEAVVEDALGLLGSDRRCVTTRSSKVRLGVEHQRPQLARPVAVDRRRACCVSPSSPRASASRLAGSIVTTTRAGPAAPPPARATAAVVVLPTPPVPEHTTIDARVDELALSSGHAARQRRRARAMLDERSVGAASSTSAAAEVGREQERQVDLRQRQPVGQPRDLLASAASRRSRRNAAAVARALGLAAA